MKRVIAILLVLALCLSFSGCEGSFSSVESLMRPPKLSGEDSFLQNAFDDAVSAYGNVIMKTPINGKYRSSYIMFDIDNDTQNEAIVLYSIPSQNNINVVQIFKQVEGSWNNVSEIKGYNDDIYEIDFADINGDGHFEILLSWNGVFNNDNSINTSNNVNKTLNVYSYDGNCTNLLVTETYTNLFVNDLNNNKTDELIILKTSIANVDNSTTVRILSFAENYSVVYDNTTYISNMIEIINIASERISYTDSSSSRLYVDGMIGEKGIVTEIISVNESNFDTSLPLYDDNQTTVPKTFRESQSYSVDIDNDGLIEVPVMEEFPYSQRISNETNVPLNITVWLEYDNNGFNIDHKSFVNMQLGFLFVLTDELMKDISVIYDEDNLNLTAYSINSKGEFQNALFSCKIFTRPEWEENNYNYEIISENETYVYAYLIFKADNREIYQNIIIDNFYAL